VSKSSAGVRGGECVRKGPDQAHDLSPEGALHLGTGPAAPLGRPGRGQAHAPPTGAHHHLQRYFPLKKAPPTSKR